MQDLSKTLEQIEGDFWNEPEYDSHLVTECHRLRKVPLLELDVENLRLLIGQNIGLKYLIPIALDILEKNPWVEGDFYPGDLLKSVLTVNGEFWNDQHEELARLGSVIEAIQELEKLFRNELHPAYLNIFGIVANQKT